MTPTPLLPRLPTLETRIIDALDTGIAITTAALLITEHALRTWREAARARAQRKHPT